MVVHSYSCFDHLIWYRIDVLCELDGGGFCVCFYHQCFFVYRISIGSSLCALSTLSSWNVTVWWGLTCKSFKMICILECSAISICLFTYRLMNFSYFLKYPGHRFLLFVHGQCCREIAQSVEALVLKGLELSVVGLPDDKLRFGATFFTVAFGVVQITFHGLVVLFFNLELLRGHFALKSSYYAFAHGQSTFDKLLVN